MSSLGPAVIDGRLQYTSPSAIKTFSDPETGCPRRGWFRYVARIKEEQSYAQKFGSDAHQRVEHYLKTKEDVLTDVERPGKRWMPVGLKPGIILVEPKIDLANPITRLADVPLIGKLDMVNLSGRYTDEDRGVLLHDQPPHVQDWKFSGDPRKWSMTAEQIRDDLAMNSYALWVENYLDGKWLDGRLEEVRLSHVYFNRNKPDAFKRTAKVSMAHATAVVRAYEPVVEKMKIVVATPDVNDVPCNLAACNAYNKICAYDAQCDRPIQDLARMMWEDEPEESKMSLLDGMDMKSEIAKLEQQEAAERAARAPAPDITKLLAEIEGYELGLPMFEGDAAAAVLDAGGEVTGYGRLSQIPAIPTVEQMTQLVADLGEKFKNGVPDALKTPRPAATDHVKVEPPASAPADVPSALPPESVLPTPSQAAEPLPPEDDIELPSAVRAAAEAQRAASPPPAEAPPADPPAPKRGRPSTGDPAEARFKKMKKGELVAEAVRLEALTADGIAADPRVPDLEAKLAEAKAMNKTLIADVKALRENKGAPSPDVADLEATLAESQAMVEGLRVDLKKAESAAAAMSPATGGDLPGVEVWIDCMPSGEFPQSLEPYIEEVLADIAKAYKVKHVLSAPNDNALAYGKWKGVLPGRVQAGPPAPGRYYLRVKGDELREQIASALGKVATVIHRGL